jgi:hypothetical protein
VADQVAVVGGLTVGVTLAAVVAESRAEYARVWDGLFPYERRGVCLRVARAMLVARGYSRPVADLMAAALITDGTVIR